MQVRVECHSNLAIWVPLICWFHKADIDLNTTSCSSLHWNYTYQSLCVCRGKGGSEWVGERHVLFCRIENRHSGAVYCNGGQKDKNQ